MPRLDVAAAGRQGRMLHQVPGQLRHVIRAIRMRRAERGQRTRSHGVIAGRLRDARRLTDGALEVHVRPAGGERQAQREPPHRDRDAGAAEDDVAGQLRPRGDRAVHLEHGCREARGHERGIHDPEHDPGPPLTGGKVLAVHPTDILRSHPAGQAMEQRQVRMQVEPLHVQHAPVARLHQHGEAALAGTLADEELQVERVALVHHDVQPVQERVHIVRRDAVVHQLHPGVRIDLPDLARGELRLSRPDLVDRGADPVHVREVQAVVVGEPQHPERPLERERERDRVAHGQARDANLDRGQPVRLGARDLVPVAVEAELAELSGRQDVDEAAGPRVMDPAAPSIQGGARQEVRRPGVQFVSGQVDRRRARIHEIAELDCERVVLAPEGVARPQFGQACGICFNGRVQDEWRLVHVRTVVARGAR